MNIWKVRRVLSVVVYEFDWKRRVVVARVTGRPINCGTMGPGYYP